MFKQKKSLHFKKPEKYKIPMIVFMVLTFLLGGTLAFVIYANYNYLAFKILIAGNYAYPAALNEIYEEKLQTKDFKNYFDNFDEVVISVFAEKIRGVNNDRYTYLYTPPQYTLSKDMTREEAKEAYFEELSKDCVYVYLPNISFYTRDFLFESKEELKEYKNIVIDLRSNGGGDLEALYDIAELFLDKGKIIGKEVARSALFTKIIKSGKKAYFDFENVVFLQNGGTASAAEGFIMSLRDNLESVLVIGEKSFGKGIGQITLPLKAGFAIKATVIKLETPSGGSIHGIGITPDIEYDGEDIVQLALGHTTQ